jgi:hypothetical protein
VRLGAERWSAVELYVSNLDAANWSHDHEFILARRMIDDASDGCRAARCCRGDGAGKRSWCARAQWRSNVVFGQLVCDGSNAPPCTAVACTGTGQGTCVWNVVEELLSDDLILTVVSRPSTDIADAYRKLDQDLNSLDDLYAALRSCWSPPSPADAVEGMQVSVLFSFDTAGWTIAAPRLTYSLPGASSATVEAYFQSVTTSLDACQPLKLSPGLGDAIAGRPIMVRYVDNRSLQKQSDIK